MEVEYPDDFRCPISLQVMSDPVILASGHTFDRVSIQRWLDSGHRTCPVTMLPLPPHSPLIPNHALRSLIANFSPFNAGASRTYSMLPEKESLISSLTYPANPATLSLLLRLAKDDLSFRHSLVNSGAPSVLLRHAASSDSHDIQGLSLRILLYLSLDGDDARVGLVADGALDPLIHVLTVGGPNAALAATTLTSLAMVEVNKCTIGAQPFAIPSLSALIRSGKGRERREAATALYELSKFPENRPRAVRSGAVPSLVSFVSDGSERAVEVLGLLAKCREGREAMRNVKGFVKVLAGVLREGSARGIEHALLVLNLICSDSVQMSLDVKQEGVEDICFMLVELDEGKVGRNALMMIRTLEKEGMSGHC
ncbi:U-box domain-containing protein 8 [Phalaenopsis equestris]|uniref:U-box domain-containing protein 8 n=1 Tax=Phalaenopsis equestris TaxID=78828 RepID=UPI0009E5C261|nr:U-box domain-containing protein 8 [Phalaenopsis equestris]XP_020599981.1 U-box domain-containing protein 8 [Phalaenopsis equestris]